MNIPDPGSTFVEYCISRGAGELLLQWSMPRTVLPANILTDVCLKYYLLQCGMLNCRIIVFRMEFDKTRWSCPWNSDQN